MTAQRARDRPREGLAPGPGSFGRRSGAVAARRERPSGHRRTAGSRPPPRTTTGPRHRRGSVQRLRPWLAEIIVLARVEGRRARRRRQAHSLPAGRRTPGILALLLRPAATPPVLAERVRQPGPHRDQPPHRLQRPRPPPAPGSRNIAPSGTPTAARAPGIAAGTPSPPASSSAGASIPPSGR